MARKAKTPATPHARDDATAKHQPSQVVFEYIKSNLFRVIHADGAIGSVTPSGNLHIAFYSERPAIPKAVVHERNEDGTLGANLVDQTVVRPGIVREMDVDVVLNASAVAALIEWLSHRQQEMNAHAASIHEVEVKRSKQRKH